MSAELKAVSDAFWVLASSFFCYEWRDDAALSLRPADPTQSVEDILVVNLDEDRVDFRLTRRHALQPNRVNADWQRITPDYHFPYLQRVLDDKTPASTDWKATLRRAAILAGQSYLARHLTEAFFLDWVAIETLLTKRGDKFPTAMTDRLVALFGWLNDDDVDEWKALVDPLYALRNAYVHDGMTGRITGMDLFNTDMLLANLLANLCRNPRMFRTKEDVITLAEEWRARRVLGLKMSRPEKLSFQGRSVTTQTRKKIEECKWVW